MMIKLELSREMVLTIAKVLQAAPYNVVAPILVEIQRQFEGQVPVPQTNGSGLEATVQ